MSPSVPATASPTRGTRPTGVYVLIAVVLAGLVLIPLFGSATLTNVATKCLIASLFAMGYNLLWGRMGLLSFGHAAYYGVGTFVALHVMNAIQDGTGFPTPLIPLVSAVIGILVGLFLGWFATRRSGVYFAMITLAVAELTHVIADKWSGFFGGEAGVRSIRSDWWLFNFQSAESVYYFALAWCLVTVLGLWLLKRSPLGLLLFSLRDNEERVYFLGYNTHALKVVGFALSAGVSALAGGLLAFMNESTNATLFGTINSAEVVLNTVMGGAAVFFGPALGATVNTLFAYYAGDFSHFWLLYQGVLFVLIIMYAPGGLGGIAVNLTRQARDGELVGLLPAYGIATLGGVLIGAGVIMVVELLGGVLSSQYRILRLTTGEQWPPVPLWGGEWAPLGMATAATVLALLIIGAGLLRLGLRLYRQRNQSGETDS